MRILLAGIAAPFAARIVPALSRGEIGKWFEQWGIWLTSRPRDFIVGWLWFLLPFAVLAGIARIRKGWAVRVAAVALFVLGVWSSLPVPGHGYRFYLGEAVFPVIAAAVLPAALLVGFLAERIAAGRPWATGRSLRE